MIDTIKQLLPSSRSISHLANQLGIPRTTLRDSLSRAGLPTDSIDNLKSALNANSHPVYKKSTHIEDLVKIAELKRNLSQVNQQHNFSIEVATEPTIFCSWSDQHIGAGGVNHQALINEVENIAKIREQDPNFILVLNGDLIDGYFAGSGHANNEQVLTIDEQRDFGKYVIERLRPELTISADHEAWSITSTLEVNFTRDVCRDNNLNYAQWQAKLFIKLDNGVTKTVLVNHRYPGKTKANPTKHLQALHAERGPADIVTTGHYHSNTGAYKLHSLRQNEEPFWGLQSGTYKLHDGYSMKLNDYVGEYGIPCCVILPDGNMYGFNHYSEGVEFVALWKQKK